MPKNKPTQQSIPTANQPKVVFQESSIWAESVTAAVKDEPLVVKKIEEFMRAKSDDPMKPFGAKDRPFASDGIYKQYLPKALKAHLSLDYSLVYEVTGNTPKTIKLYGVFNHADLGTGQPANKRRMKTMAQRLASVFEEDPHRILADLDRALNEELARGSV